jgi:hypothetical protein
VTTWSTLLIGILKPPRSLSGRGTVGGCSMFARDPISGILFLLQCSYDSYHYISRRPWER